MAVTKERFEQGMTYDAYKAQMTRSRDRLIQIEQTFQPSAEAVAAFQRLPQPLNVLVIAEDWCGDVIANVPLLGKLGQVSGKLNLRVFLRDQNEDIMNQYLNQGKFKSIPVFAFFDQNMRQLGVFIERPASVTAERAEFRQQLFARHPEWGGADTPQGDLPEPIQQQVQNALVQHREEKAAWANAEVVRELCAIVEGATSPA